LKKGDVKSVFDEYDDVLNYFFLFYSRCEHHSIGQDYEEDMVTMDFREFIRFGYQVNIVPTIIPVEDMNHVFHRLIRERETEFPEKIHKVLDYDFFKRALVRIACLGQENLGGQKNQALEKLMEEENKKKDEDKEKKKKLNDKWERAHKKVVKYENQNLD
jgi:hypothetical protein